MEPQEHQSAGALASEDIWAMFRETDRLIKENARRMAAETERLFKGIALQSKETDRKISKSGSRLGELIENPVASSLLKKFEEQGLFFTRTNINILLKNADRSFLTEIDIFLEAGETAPAVEVKSKLAVPDVEEHLARMEKLRRYTDERGNRRTFIGAVAGGIIPGGVTPFAIEKGLFVVEQSGDTAVISVPEGFLPPEMAK